MKLAKRFRINDDVIMNEIALENYGEQYAGVVFRIKHVATSTDNHPGFDSSSGAALYDLTLPNGEVFNNSLYDWELDKA